VEGVGSGTRGTSFELPRNICPIVGSQCDAVVEPDKSRGTAAVAVAVVDDASPTFTTDPSADPAAEVGAAPTEIISLALVKSLISSFSLNAKSIVLAFFLLLLLVLLSIGSPLV
jgi:hypothetical protein